MYSGLKNGIIVQQKNVIHTQTSAQIPKKSMVFFKFTFTRVPVSSQYTRVVWECAKNPY